MFAKHLERIRSNPTIISNFKAAVAVLEENYIFYFLVALGRPQRTAKSSLDELANEGAYAAGWQDCLDHLLNFEEYYLSQKKSSVPLNPDYGGKRKLLEEGRITEEEYKHGYTDPAKRTKPSGGNK